MYSNPERVRFCPRALRKSSGTEAAPRSDGLPQGQGPFPSPLAVDQNAGLRLQLEILQAESHEFGDSEACRKTQVEHRPVSDPQPVCRVRSIQQELRLLSGQVRNDSGIGFLDRDG